MVESAAGNFPKAVLSVSREEFYGQDREHQPLKLTIKDGKTGEETKLPDDLQGHVFIIGPAGSVGSAIVDADHPLTVLPSQDGWTPLVNGDGMVYRLDFHKTLHQEEQGEAWLTTRLVKTPSFYGDRLTHNETKYRHLRFWNFGISRYSLQLGLCNQVNTAFVPVKFSQEDSQRLVVTNDASIPYEIDPYTLKVLSPIGLNKDWTEAIASPFKFPFRTILSSAHPAFDPNTGEMFTVNLCKSIGDLLPQSRTNKDLDLGFLSQKLKQEVRNTFWVKPINFLLNLQQASKKKSEQDGVYLICWVGKETVEKWQVILADGESVKIRQACHMMGITENYVLLADAAFKLGLGTILPSSLMMQLQNWIQDIDDDLDDITTPKIAKGIQKVISEIVEWFRSHLTYPQSPDTYLYLIPRNQLAQIKSGGKVIAKKIIIPGECSHYLTDYQELDGKIIIHGGMNYATDPAEFIHRQDSSVYEKEPEIEEKLKSISGMMSAGMDVNSPAVIIVDPAQESVQKKDLSLSESLKYTFYIGLYAYRDYQPNKHFQDFYWTGGGAWAEMATELIYDLYKKYPHRRLTTEEILRIIKQEIPVILSRFHIDYDHILSLETPITVPDSYQFPPGYYPNSPIFFPRANTTGATEGYLVCNVIYSDKLAAGFDNQDWSNNSEIWIFAGDNLSQGPLYKLSHPQLNFGLTIHTTWLPEIKPQPASNYNVQQDYDWLVAETSKQYRNNPLFWLITRGKGKKIAQDIENLFKDIYQAFNKD